MQYSSTGGNLEYGSAGNSSFPQTPPGKQEGTNKFTLKKKSKTLIQQGKNISLSQAQSRWLQYSQLEIFELY